MRIYIFLVFILIPEIVLAAPGYVYQSITDQTISRLMAYQVGFIEVVAATVIAIPALLTAVKVIVSLINKI